MYRAFRVILLPVLTLAALAAEVRFEKRVLEACFRSEGVAVADFTHDGRLDIANGIMLYVGPDWQAQPMLGEAKEFDPKSYSTAFLCFAAEISGDGWQDLVVVGYPNAETIWLQNPAGQGGPWARHVAVAKTGNESPLWVDLDRDGRRELLFTAPAGVAVAGPGADPAQPWPVRVIAAGGEPQPVHGLGCGDVNGDGRDDVLCPDGWWEGQGTLGQAPWPFHRVKLAESCAQMVVMDADGDGDADILSSSAHAYGICWAEQTATGWDLHEIDKSISQTHALHLADIDRDGLMDFVTGKRFWAHVHGDPGGDEPAVLAWFALQRCDGKPVWTRHVIDDNSGVGLQFQIIDVDLDGRLDVVTSNKKGAHLFRQSP